MSYFARMKAAILLFVGVSLISVSGLYAQGAMTPYESKPSVGETAKGDSQLKPGEDGNGPEFKEKPAMEPKKEDSDKPLTEKELAKLLNDPNPDPQLLSRFLKQNPECAIKGPLPPKKERTPGTYESPDSTRRQVVGFRVPGDMQDPNGPGTARFFNSDASGYQVSKTYNNEKDLANLVNPKGQVMQDAVCGGFAARDQNPLFGSKPAVPYIECDEGGFHYWNPGDAK